MQNLLEDNPEIIPSTIYISLYLFLLIFFVLINSISQKSYSEAKEIMQKVNVDFHNTNALSKPPIANTKFFAYDLEKELKSYYNAYIQKIFANDFDLLALDEDDKNNFAKISIPTSRIFKQSSDEIYSEDILLALLNLLNNQIEKSQVRLEILIGSDTYSDNLLDTRLVNILKILARESNNFEIIKVGIEKTHLSEKIVFSFFLN